MNKEYVDLKEQRAPFIGLIMLVILIVGIMAYDLFSDDPTQELVSKLSITELLPIFPGAEGYGTRGPAGSGRNSSPPNTQIFTINTLADHGAGSFRECLEAKVPRTCLFEVSGVIWMQNQVHVTSPYLSVFGETAPDPGIIIRGSGISVEASDVMIRHIKIRPGDDPRDPCCKAGSCSPAQQLRCVQDPGSRDGLNVYAVNGPINNVVADHLSITWALDEGWSINPDKGDVTNVTFSNSIIGQGLDMSIHPEASNPSDPGHSKASLLKGNKGIQGLSYHHNLLAHNADRNVRIGSPSKIEYINNLIYNWGRGRGRGRTIEAYQSGLNMFDLIGNVYKPGLDTFCPETDYRKDLCFENGQDGIDSPTERKGMHYILRVGDGKSGGLISASRYFLKGNISNTRLAGEDEWNIADSGFFTSSSRISLIYPENKSLSPVAQSGTVTTFTAGDVNDYLVSNAGAFNWTRDSVDTALFDQIASGTGRIINCVAPDGTERCRKNAGGWPNYISQIRKLNIPQNPMGDDNGDGYTNLENYVFTFPNGEPSPPTPSSSSSSSSTSSSGSGGSGGSNSSGFSSSSSAGSSSSSGMCWLPCPSSSSSSTSSSGSSSSGGPGVCETRLITCANRCEECRRYMQGKISSMPYDPNAPCFIKFTNCLKLCEVCGSLKMDVIFQDQGGVSYQ